MEVVETILLTNLFYFMPNKAPVRNEHFIKLSRQASIHLLDMEYQEMVKNEIDVADEYEETISFLRTINDAEFEEMKSELITGFDSV